MISVLRYFIDGQAEMNREYFKNQKELKKFIDNHGDDIEIFSILEMPEEAVRCTNCRYFKKTDYDATCEINTDSWWYIRNWRCSSGCPHFDIKEEN
jgi:hypothetical protein